MRVGQAAPLLHYALLAHTVAHLQFAHRQQVHQLQALNNSPSRYQHYLLNHTVDVDGDEAHAETYYLFVGTDREPANHMTISGGRYIDRLERRDGRWAIVDRVCLVEFIDESQSLLTEEAIAAVAGARTPHHGMTDASYDRPLTAARTVTQ